jgi:hypothetical protein
MGYLTKEFLTSWHVMILPVIKMKWGDWLCYHFVGFQYSSRSYFMKLCRNGVVESTSKLLEGEICAMVLWPPKGVYVQYLCVVSITSLSCSFQPIMAILRKLYTYGMSILNMKSTFKSSQYILTFSLEMVVQS